LRNIEFSQLLARITPGFLVMTIIAHAVRRKIDQPIARIDVLLADGDGWRCWKSCRNLL
jgi:hypothetical protein